ncbi:putative ribonuclease H-like domain-containing protein, partial [Tanacetum coccineum]
YSTNSKAFKIFKNRTRIVEENLHVKFSNQSNGNASTKACDNAGKARMETIPGKDYILLPLSIQDLPFSYSSKDSPDAGFKPLGKEEKKDAKDPGNEDIKVPSTKEPKVNQEKDASVDSINTINTVSPTVNTAGIEDNAVDENIVYGCDDDPNMPELEEIVYSDDYEDVGAEADINNLDTHILIEAIRLFLAYASFKDFVVYQMDVKSAFLYGNIEEEVYVCQPLGFEDLNFPDRVYKRGTIDKTLFIRRDKGDILLVQVYVDDIIFGSTKKSLCTEFEKMIHKKFQMSSMGELTFFLGLQVRQKENGIFISQDKYLKGQPKLGLWYPKDLPFDLVAYTNSDYAGASLDRKSTTGGCQFLGCRLISWQCKKQTVVANSTTEAEYIAASN